MHYKCSASTMADAQCAECRIAEIIVLNSIYPGQFHCYNASLKKAVEEEDWETSFHGSIEGYFTIDTSLEVHFSLPPNYPEQDNAQIHCRVTLGTKSRDIQKELNERVSSLLNSSEDKLVDILPKIKEIWFDQMNNKLDEVTQENESIEQDCLTEDKSRLWIYSHHIKSSAKRKLIMELSKKLNLNGFMLIGKPGFICVEGVRADCDHFWSQIRALNWQRISLFETQYLSTEDCYLFSTFDEFADKSAIFAILKAKNYDTIIKTFLGING